MTNEATNVAADRQRPPSDELNVEIPHSARVYDFWLGGKDNFDADRAFANAVTRIIPAMPAMARANRAWMHRVVRYLVGEAGVRQFLDIGTGLPTAQNLHQVAQEIDPTCRVVYVDNDPLVLVHARALLVSSPQGACQYLHGDLRRPTQILHSAEVTGTLDLTEPIAVTLAAVLMLLPDEARPPSIVETLREWLPAGSYVAISHPTGDFNPDVMAQAVAAAQQAGFTFVPRTEAQVAQFFGDWPLVDPGLVPLLNWRPDDGPPEDPQAAYFWAGVAHKPAGTGESGTARPP